MQERKLSKIFTKKNLFNAVPLLTLVFSVLVSIALGLWLNLYDFLSSPANLAGIFVIIFGIFVINHSLYQLVRNKTDIRPGGSPAVLVTTGFYKYSRNPVYTGHVFIIIGVCILMGEISSFLGLVIYIFILNFFVIPKEEENLSRQFGEEYEFYREQTRRWV